MQARAVIGHANHDFSKGLASVFAPLPFPCYRKSVSLSLYGISKTEALCAVLCRTRSLDSTDFQTTVKTKTHGRSATLSAAHLAAKDDTALRNNLPPFYRAILDNSSAWRIKRSRNRAQTRSSSGAPKDLADKRRRVQVYRRGYLVGLCDCPLVERNRPSYKCARRLAR